MLCLASHLPVYTGMKYTDESLKVRYANFSFTSSSSTDVSHQHQFVGRCEGVHASQCEIYKHQLDIKHWCMTGFVNIGCVYCLRSYFDSTELKMCKCNPDVICSRNIKDCGGHLPVMEFPVDAFRCSKDSYYIVMVAPLTRNCFGFQCFGRLSLVPS